MGDAAPLAFIEFVDRTGELRPAKTCNEKTQQELMAKWEEAKKVYREREEARNARLSEWKSLVAPNPYKEPVPVKA